MPTRARSPEEFARRWMRRWKVPGASVAVVERGRPTVTRAYGYRNRERRLPATPRTAYGLASVTKSFTALAILMLQEAGKLSVQDPVVRYLPGFRTPDPRWTRRIRIHHFLTHSSGLPPLPSIYYTSMRSTQQAPPYDPKDARRVGIDPDHAPIDSYDQMLDFLATARYRPLGPPGRVFSYSNEGFGLLGAVIEAVTDRTHESYLDEAILRPAGMRSTTYDTGVLFRYPERTTLYSPKWTGTRHGFVPSETWWEDNCLRACGGLRSTVDDLARYLQLYVDDGRVDGERIVSAASMRALTTPHVPLGSGVSYGYGVMVAPDHPAGPLVTHTGGLPGVSSCFVAAPKRGVAAVVLSNAEGVSAALVAQAELNARLGLPLDAEFSTPPPPAPAGRPLADYAGWYASGEGIWLEVRTRPDGLRFDFRGIEVTARNLTLRPAGDDAFLLRYGGQRGAIRFRRDDRGRVTGVFLGSRVLRRRSRAELRGARRGTTVW